MIQDCGLNVKVVDVESYAGERACALLTHSLPDEGEGKTIAIIDIGARMTNLTVMKDLATVFTREEVFGGMQLTEQIMERYDLSFQEAGRAKKEGSLPDDYEFEVLTPFKETAVLQVRRALQFFFSTSQHCEINYILLAGCTVQLDGFAEMIEEQMGIPTSIANPFFNMQVSDQINLPSLKSDASAMLISCGLALRGLNGEATAG